ncbi:MAG: hypothetical protein AAF915_25815, partial [Cyanobacteria bacterium P01_D01_bin.50]
PGTRTKSPESPPRHLLQVGKPLRVRQSAQRREPPHAAALTAQRSGSSTPSPPSLPLPGNLGF